VPQTPIKKTDEHQQQFLDNLVLGICKGYKTSLSTCENIWLQLGG
jgi:hypothetical protein